jgi:hypothetical protein
MADGPSSSGTAHAAEVPPALREQAGKVADKSLSSGVDAAHAVGKAAESAAQVLDDALPMLAGYVRNAAQYTDRFADSLRDRKAEELLSTAVSWSRQQPLLTLAGAAVLGFALSRIARSGMPAKDESPAQTAPVAEHKPAYAMSASGGGNAG